MKKIFMLFTACLMAIAINAQTANEHLKFKGVPIDGTLSQYVQKMKTAGFSMLGMENGAAILQGDFAGYKECTISVETLKDKDLVAKIIVAFPDCNTWSELHGSYLDLKFMLAEKYGAPSDCLENFQGYSDQRDDNFRMIAVRLDRCRYITTFSTKAGDIQLKISHKGMSSCYVTLSYYDKINSDILRKQAIDDL
ncbi:MAG: hypothetical protein K5854_07670 [Prevotella sp.]|nr:hypothetical protein [Prevotella sp.]